MGQLLDLIEADQYRVYGSSGKKNRMIAKMKYPGFKYMCIFRKANFYKKNNRIKYLWNRILLHFYGIKYGIEMSPENKIGKGFYIGHIGSITLYSKVVIGENVNILKGVLIGYNPRGKYKGCPTIGNNVWIGPNAVIVGNIKVGNNVLIAPNTLVNRDVPDNSVVVGNPSEIIPNDKATEGYINFTV